MTATKFAAKFVLTFAILIALAGCQGVYVAGDAGPHSSRASPSNR